MHSSGENAHRIKLQPSGVQGIFLRLRDLASLFVCCCYFFFLGFYLCWKKKKVLKKKIKDLWKPHCFINDMNNSCEIVNLKKIFRLNYNHLYVWCILYVERVIIIEIFVVTKNHNKNRTKKWIGVKICLIFVWYDIFQIKRKWFTQIEKRVSTMPVYSKCTRHAHHSSTMDPFVSICTSLLSICWLFIHICFHILQIILLHLRIITYKKECD